MTIIWIMVAAPLVFWLATFVYTSYRGSPYVPLPAKRLRQVSRYVEPGDWVVDLGCGDGRVLVAALEKGAVRAEGYELDALVYLMAVLKTRTQTKSRGQIQIHFGDFWKADVSRASLVYVYQLEKYMTPFKDKILSQLAPGTRIVSPDYPIAGLTPISSRDRVFVYRV